MTVGKCRSLLRVSGVSFLLFIFCYCLQFQPVSARLDQGTVVEQMLPGKLRDSALKDSSSKNYNPEKKNLTDELEHKDSAAAAAKPRPGKGQTWQQWLEEGGDSSEFFTMDYSRVRRRRPIHNKGLPVGP